MQSTMPSEQGTVKVNFRVVTHRRQQQSPQTRWSLLERNGETIDRHSTDIWAIAIPVVGKANPLPTPWFS